MLQKEKWFKDGVIVNLPKKDLVRKELLEYIVASDFKEEEMYTEKEVNERLKKYYPDYVFLRRLMIEYRLLGRERDGSRYWIEKQNDCRIHRPV